MFDGPSQAPGQHAAWTNREVLGVGIDLVLSLGTLAGVVVLARTGRLPEALMKPPVVAAVVAALLVSFVNRVVLQWVFGATVGKALCGLKVVRRHDRARPGLLDLLRSWLFSFGYALAEEAGMQNEKTGRFLLGSARR